MSNIRTTLIICITVLTAIALFIYAGTEENKYNFLKATKGVYIVDKNSGAANYCNAFRCTGISEGFLHSNKRAAPQGAEYPYPYGMMPMMPYGGGYYGNQPTPYAYSQPQAQQPQTGMGWFEGMMHNMMQMMHKGSAQHPMPQYSYMQQPPYQVPYPYMMPQYVIPIPVPTPVAPVQQQPQQPAPAQQPPAKMSMAEDEDMGTVTTPNEIMEEKMPEHAPTDQPHGMTEGAPQPQPE